MPVKYPVLPVVVFVAWVFVHFCVWALFDDFFVVLANVNGKFSKRILIVACSKAENEVADVVGFVFACCFKGDKFVVECAFGFRVAYARFAKVYHVGRLGFVVDEYVVGVKVSVNEGNFL